MITFYFHYRKFSLDDLLTNVMIYWTTNSIIPSMRFYKENIGKGLQPHKYVRKWICLNICASFNLITRVFFNACFSLLFCVSLEFQFWFQQVWQFFPMSWCTLQNCGPGRSTIKLWATLWCPEVAILLPWKNQN